MKRITRRIIRDLPIDPKDLRIDFGMVDGGLGKYAKPGIRYSFRLFESGERFNGEEVCRPLFYNNGRDMRRYSKAWKVIHEVKKYYNFKGVSVEIGGEKLRLVLGGGKTFAKVERKL
jgi:hypothetical protein